MDKQKLILDLKKLILDLGLKNSEIETELSFPKNGLSNFLSLKKELPDKWIEPIEKFIAQKLSPTKEVEIPKIETKVEEPTKMVVDSEGFKNMPKKLLLNEVMAKINKDYGTGTVMLFGDKPNQNYDVISTGSLGLDLALGIGGLPRGRIIEIYGWESSGKSTISLNVIANAQKKGLNCLLVDAENSFDPEYATALGVNTEDLQYCQPSYGEQGLEVADRFILSGQIGVVVIDSVAALVPKSELEGEMGDSKMGLHARLMSQACRKLVNTVAHANVLCIFINQLRHKIGGYPNENPEVTTGGKALQFYSSVRLEVRRSITEKNSIMNGEIKEGNQTTVKVIKNKCCPPFRKATFNIIYGEGIDRIGEVIDLGVDFGIIKKSGSWFTVAADGAKLGQGKETVKDTLLSNPELAEIIESQILEKINKA